MALYGDTGGGGVGVRGAFPLRRHRASGLAARLAAPPTAMAGLPTIVPSVASQMQQQLAQTTADRAASLVGPHPLAGGGAPAAAKQQMADRMAQLQGGLQAAPPGPAATVMNPAAQMAQVNDARSRMLGPPSGAPPAPHPGWQSGAPFHPGIGVGVKRRPGISSSLARKPRRYDMGGMGY